MSPSLRSALGAALLGLAPTGSALGQEPRDPAATAILEQVGFDQRPGAQLPLDARLVDEEGATRTLGELLARTPGRPTVLVFAYYECPMLCTLVLNGLVRALRALELDAGRDFGVLVVGIDPDEGYELARAKRRGYLEEYGREGVGGGWSFTVGAAEQVRRIADAAGFRYAYVPERDEWAHAGGLLVLTPDGRASRAMMGVEFAPRDLRLALVESGEGRIGGLVEQALLLCFHYDPTTGRYGLAIVSVVRLLGIATLCALVGFVARSLRRERRAAEGGA